MACVPAPKVRIAVAMLDRDDRVLMVHRHPRREWYADCWDLVGGHLEHGETPEDAVRRECLEEIGVEVCDPIPIALRISDPNLEMFSFLVHTWEGEPANIALEEHDDLRWFTADELVHLTVADEAAVPDMLALLRA